MLLTRKRPRPARIVESAPSRFNVKLILYGTLAFASFYLVATVGFHAMKVSYWPRFTQGDVLSDLVWLAFAWLFWIVLLTIATGGPPLLIGSVTPGSWISEDARTGLKVRDSLTFDQLSLLTVAWTVIPNIVAASRSQSLNTGLTTGFVTGCALLGCMVMWGTYRKRSADRGWSGPQTKAFFTALLKVRSAQSAVSAFRMLTFPLLQLLGVGIGYFFFSQTTSKFAVWYASVFSDPSNAEDPVAFLAAICFSLGVWSALMLAYQPVVSSGKARRFPWQASMLGLALSVLFLLLYSTSGILELARVANLRNVSVVFDEKLEPLVSRLTATQKAGSFGMAKLDVVFSFGSEVVVASPGTFRKGARCSFDWLTGTQPAADAKSAKDVVRCLSLPKASVSSIT